MQEVERKLATALEPEPDVVFAYLFGSVVKGRSGPLSDVDVAVYLCSAQDSQARFERRLELISKLSRALARDDVDLVVLQEAQVDLAFEILANGVLILSKNEGERKDFVFKTLRDYHDGAYQRKFEWEVIREYLAEGKYGRPPRRHQGTFEKTP